MHKHGACLCNTFHIYLFIYLFVCSCVDLIGKLVLNTYNEILSHYEQQQVMLAKIKSNTFTISLQHMKCHTKQPQACSFYDIQNLLHDTVKHNEGCLQKRFPEIN